MKRNERSIFERYEHLIKFHESTYKEEPTDLFSSPGRMEIIGNHTDHNNGLVIVGSVDLYILATASKSDDNCFSYQSKGFPTMVVSLDDLDVKESEYGTSLALIRGVLKRIKELGHKIGGIKVTTATTIFKGAGVSSSAAFENLIVELENYYYNQDKISPLEMAKISQYSEVKYFNKPCGLLDQLGISQGGLNFIDFKDVNNPVITSLPLDKNGLNTILVNTRDSHAKLTKNYSSIKDDMYDVAHFFNKEVLREVDENEFYNRYEEIVNTLGESKALRAKHYFEENKRVLKCKEAIINKDTDAFLEAINSSGESSFYNLKNCYVKNEKENLPKGILYSKKINPSGATRVHGGGFAGTFISFVKDEDVGFYLKKMRNFFTKNDVKMINITDSGTRHVLSVEGFKKLGVKDE